MRDVTILRLAALVGTLVVAPSLATGAAPEPVRAAIALVLLAGSLFARGRWWLFRVDRAGVDEALATTCRMALAKLAVTPHAYRIETARGATSLGIARRGPAFELRFGPAWARGKKSALMKALIAKQFEPVIPRLRIRLRRRR